MVSPVDLWPWVTADLTWHWLSHSGRQHNPSYFVVRDHELHPVVTRAGMSYEEHAAVFADVRLFYLFTPRLLAYLERKAGDARRHLPPDRFNFYRWLGRLHYLQRWAFCHFDPSAMRTAREAALPLPEAPFPSVDAYRAWDWYTRDIDAWSLRGDSVAGAA